MLGPARAILEPHPDVRPFVARRATHSARDSDPLGVSVW